MNTLLHASASTRWFLPVAASAGVVAVVLAMVFGVSAARNGNDPTHLPVLHLSSVAGGSLGLSAAVAADASGKGGAPGSSPGGSGWRLEGKLPDGPSSGQVHLLPAGSATRDFVSALARSLGMSGPPQHLKDGWYLVSGTTELSVSELAGRRWTYSNHGCLAGPVLNPQMSTACAVAQSVPAMPPTPSTNSTPGGSGLNAPPTASQPGRAPEPAPVPENIARRTARPVLAAVGVNPGSARVETAGDQRSVVFSPEVAGFTVLGLETRVSMDEHAQIVDASGWLATSTMGATYPLISARQGYNQLLQQPQPMMLSSMPCRIVSSTQGCVPAPDHVITGATLGLTQAYSTDRGIQLVPAWLFQVRGDPTPLAVVAVDRAYLGEPKKPSPGGEPTAGSIPGNIGGANRTNDSTQNSGPPTRVGRSDQTTAPGTKPTR
jgi:hypothetical protein